MRLNETNTKLKLFLETFPLEIIPSNESNIDFYKIIAHSNADTAEGIFELEDKMKNLLPKIKQRISAYIERGKIAKEIKKITDYKCLICEKLGMPSHSFLKSNGEYYVETHHIEQVSTLKNGVLGVTNLITVCANHHRQLHYGCTEILLNTDEHVSFKIDNDIVQILKIDINQYNKVDRNIRTLQNI